MSSQRQAKQLLIATGNPGKVKEMNKLLATLPLEAVGLAAFPALPEPEETGATFEANALLKARYYHEHTGLLTVADDSGLMVDALNGRPGLYSARYAGPQASDEDRYRKLLDELAGVPTEQRTAQFVCAVALLAEDWHEIYTGRTEGLILTEPRGTGGFGYDPIFYYPPLAKTFAELTPEEKATVSHRGRAFAQLLPRLRALLVAGDHSPNRLSY